MKDRFDRLGDNQKLSSPNSNSQIIAARFFGTIRWAEERSKGGKDFSQEEMGFFEALAEMRALATENARMYEQLRKGQNLHQRWRLEKPVNRSKSIRPDHGRIQMGAT
jgi:GAF domain-containing protein